MFSTRVFKLKESKRREKEDWEKMKHVTKACMKHIFAIDNHFPFLSSNPDFFRGKHFLDNFFCRIFFFFSSCLASFLSLHLQQEVLVQWIFNLLVLLVVSEDFWTLKSSGWSALTKTCSSFSPPNIFILESFSDEFYAFARKPSLWMRMFLIFGWTTKIKSITLLRCYEVYGWHFYIFLSLLRISTLDTMSFLSLVKYK